MSSFVAPTGGLFSSASSVASADLFLAERSLLDSVDPGYTVVRGLGDPVAFPATVSSRVCTPCNYDNAISISVTPVPELLTDMVPLDTPFPLGGIGAGVRVTHRGFLRFLPRHLGLCYYAADASATLIGLGFIQSQGGSYASVGLAQLRVLDRDGSVLDVGSMASNRLTTVSPALLAATTPCSIPRVVPAAFQSAPVCFPCSVTSDQLASVLPSSLMPCPLFRQHHF